MFKVHHMKKYFRALFIFILTSYFLSCSKKEEDNNTPKGPCSDFSSPYVGNDGPVQMGGSLRLSASSNEQNITFLWTGPKNFSSDLQYPVISNISFDAGGTYYARVSNNTCLSNTSPTNVVVEAPCIISDNSGTFGSSSWDFNSLITCGIYTPGYTILASSINGDLKITFAPDYIPTNTNKIYTVDDPSTAGFDSTVVGLRITNSSGDIFTGQNGNVYVSNYGNLSVVFCNVPFKSGTTGATITGEAKINCH